jgi:D-glycero-alpha-D-manno-heptose-7-phosphate kinase
MEQVILNENVGVQDQIHAAFGGLARYEFSGDTFSIEPLRLTTSRLTLINRSMILVYTGAQRSASAVLQSQEARTKSGSNADYLREMYEMTRVGTTILESEGDDLTALGRFAELLDHGWKLKQQLSTSVTTSAIDDLYKAGKELGAKGGKLLGAGGGGFVLFMVDPDLHPAFEERFGKQNIIPISMTNGGSTVAWVS